MQQSFGTIQQLVADFKAQEAAYLSPSYQESQVRQDFIDKFFAALGWDVTHERQKNPYEQEVHIENKVKMAGSSQRRADYAFFLSPNFRDPKFFVEAKKPSRNLANADDYYQAIRYGWNAKTPLAILTDFEEFHILDCRFKPDINDALNRKVASFHYTDYADNEKFAHINCLFSRDAVAAGAIEKRATELPKPRGKAGQKGASRGAYQAVDEAFLEELDEYRITLAKAFKKANEKLEGEELTEAVQRTIDRLVFIRFLEDKGIEEKSIINLKGQKSTWKAFTNLCKRCEPKYNGLVFKPHHILDEITFAAAEDKMFAEICAELADPASPYDFNQIPISILGSIYERFLGKVVHATDKRVKVEEKPEVRKAGGVYYTPEYIVCYIVKETVGKLIEGKTPAEIAPMAFADIACGSGSFLIEVYAQLLDYHVRYYLAHPDKAKPDDVFERDGQLQLTLKKKKEILLNNIYGVDLDFQATEVTQLSLYLKLLEDATMNDAHQFGLFKETILPDLKNNIVCGNSLIGRDILDGSLFPNADDSKLKPMNMGDVFPKVIKRGGFDSIVGNPPYIRIQTLNESSPESVEYLKGHFTSAASGNYDIYVVFVERGISLLRWEGSLGFILPHKFFSAQYGEGLRRIVADGMFLDKVVHFGENQVFAGATTYTCLLFLSKRNKTQFRFAKVGDIETWEKDLKADEIVIEEKSISGAQWIFGDAGDERMFRRLESTNRKASEVFHIFVGTQTSADDVYVLENCDFGRLIVKGESASLTQRVNVESDVVKKFLKGKDIRRYRPLHTSSVMICPYLIGDTEFNLIQETDFKRDFPKAHSYLQLNKTKLMNREGGRFKGPNWYAFGYPKSMTLFSRPKIVVPDYNNTASFTIDVNGHFFKTGYGLLPKDDVHSPKYLLALLNSKLLFWCLKRVSTALRGGYVRFWTKYTEQLPIHVIDFDDSSQRSKHDHLVDLVDQIMYSEEKLSAAKTDAEKNRLELQCESLDRQIDEAVYELYGLTDEEIKIVEASK
jgi:type I restriction-modification system DNA methylase subunit